MLWLPSSNMDILSFLLDTVLLVELVDTSSSLSSLLLTGIEGMTLGADLHVDALLGRACHKSVTTVAGNGSLIIIRMYTLFHNSPLSKYLYT